MNNTKSKIDWNLKYAFPKESYNYNQSKNYQSKLYGGSNLFDYKVKSSKIDIMNQNLDKKILKS
jgi:hypothetical protein